MRKCTFMSGAGIDFWYGALRVARGKGIIGNGCIARSVIGRETF